MPALFTDEPLGDPHQICPKTRFASDPRCLVEKLYAQMALIREFENCTLRLFESGKLFGTTHCHIGQEANAVGVINHLVQGDIIFSNHRCHGHFLTYANRPDLLMAELMGRTSGVVGGRGGSQHLCHGGFYSNGIQGGIVPTAAGMALAEKFRQSNNIAVTFIGDGTLGQGIVYETLNMVSLWSIPLLVVVENNHWAQTTPSHAGLAGDMVARAAAFNITTDSIASTDAEEIYEHFGPIVDSVRATQRPCFVVIDTYRLCHHSKNDDFRPQSEVIARQAKDPLKILAPRLDELARFALHAQAVEQMDQVTKWAEMQPFPNASDVLMPMNPDAIITPTRRAG